MTPTATDVERRLREASRLSDLRADQRLAAKIDLSAKGVERRLRQASDLFDACNEIARLKNGTAVSPRRAAS